MDDDARQMLRQTLTKVLAQPGGGSLATRLEDLEWQEMDPDDRRQALKLLFEVKGDLAAPGDALGPAMADVVAGFLHLPGRQAPCVVLAESLRADGAAARVEDDWLLVKGIALTAPTVDQDAVIRVMKPDGDVQLAVVPAGTIWQVGPAAGADPSAGLVPVDATVVCSAASWIDPEPSAAAWEAVVALARWTLASELLGIAGHVVSGAVAYARQRQQYGRAIGSFQAVQHRLASAHATVVGARSVVDEAAVSGLPWVALVAKALAGHAAEVACTQAQQVYGAIGFTWEHELHRYLRRMYVLDWLLGDWRSLETEIGRQLRVSGTVPRIGTL